MTIKAKMDISGWKAGLAKLDGPLRESLASSMAVAGGVVLRDEAELLAPVDEGVFRDSLYLARKDAKSNENQVTYSVSWNHRKAPHGHLLEFGHWQPYRVVKTPGGEWFTTKERLPSPKWISARPTLRPAFDSAHQRAMQAMVERGRQRLPQLLAGDSSDGA